MGPNDTLTLSPFGECCVKLWEEDSLEPKLHAYDDGTGTPTIGWGCTKGVTMGMTITPEQAQQMLDEEMKPFIEAARRRITVKLTQNQFDAVVIFLYNEGSGSGASIIKAINAQNFDAVPGAFMLYTKAKTHGKLVVWPGLVERRHREIMLWNGTYKDSRIPADIAMNAPVEESAPTPTPPAVEPNKPVVTRIITSKSFWALLNAKVLTVIALMTTWLQDAFKKLVDLFEVFPDAVSDAGQTVSSGQQVAQWLHFDFTKVALSVVLVSMAVAMVRHIRDKEVHP